MLSAIAFESTDMLGANTTERFLYPPFNWVSLRITGHAMDLEFFSQIHAILRKTGHVTGYGILCGLTFRAVRGTARATVLRINSGGSGSGPVLGRHTHCY